MSATIAADGRTPGGAGEARMADGDETRRTRQRWPPTEAAALFRAAAASAALGGTYLLALCWSGLAAGNGLLAVGAYEQQGGPSAALVWALIGAAVASSAAHVAPARGAARGGLPRKRTPRGWTNAAVGVIGPGAERSYPRAVGFPAPRGTMGPWAGGGRGRAREGLARSRSGGGGRPPARLGGRDRRLRDGPRRSGPACPKGIPVELCGVDMPALEENTDRREGGGTSGRLPETGGPVPPAVFFAGVLLAGGALVLGVARRG